MGLAQGHKAALDAGLDRNPLGFESSTLTLRCAPKISSTQNKIGPQK